MLPSFIRSSEDGWAPVVFLVVFLFLFRNVCFATHRLLHIADFSMVIAAIPRREITINLCVLIPLLLNVAMLGWDQLIDVFNFLPSDMHYAIPHAG